MTNQRKAELEIAFITGQMAYQFGDQACPYPYYGDQELRTRWVDGWFSHSAPGKDHPIHRRETD